MSTTTEGTDVFSNNLPKSLFANLKQGQEFALGQLNQFVSPVREAFTSVPEFAKELPKPEAFVSAACDFADAVLASQQKFADRFVALLSN